MQPLPLDLDINIRRLQDEGYEVSFSSGYILVSHIPYLNTTKELKYGILACPIEISGNGVAPPRDHIISFSGEFPCNEDGAEMSAIRLRTRRTVIGDVICSFDFSNKPPNGYPDFYQKFLRYVEIISAPARSMYPDATAQTFKTVASETDSVFEYYDTFSSRAHITEISSRLAEQKIAIIGLGGTGSYVLDFVAKTPVREIHLFDDDSFLQHNAFRSPGAASLATINEQLAKVDYLARCYSNMHRGVVPHKQRISDNAETLLAGMSFVFICMDSGPHKKLILDALFSMHIPFVDCGMGVEQRSSDGALFGTVRTTLYAGLSNRHEVEKHVSFSSPGQDAVYNQNIQIVELNALNAALAVIQWKSTSRFYIRSASTPTTLFNSAEGDIIHD